MKKIVFLVSLTVLFFTAKSQTAGDYRSTNSGDWSTLSVWERYDGAAWQPATIAPSSTDETITVRSPHGVTITSATTADQLVIDAGGTLTLLSTLTVADAPGTDITCNGAFVLTSTLTGTGSSLINGTINWTLGTVSSPLTISATGVATLSTASTKAIANTITNNGVINWSAGNLNFTAGTLTNAGTINASFDGSFSDFGGVNALNNSGTINKTITTGTTSIDVSFTNSGVINVLTGTIATTSLVTSNFNTGTSLTGNGILVLNGTVNINAAMAAPSTLLINKASGSTAGVGTFTINGTINWTGGTLGSPFIIASGATLAASSSLKTLSAALVINGTMNWSGGDINCTNGSLTNNGVFNTSHNGNLANTSGTNSFTNAGVFTKTAGAGLTIIGAPTTNSGTINVNAGTVFKNSTAITNTGTIAIAASCTFTSNVTMNLNAGTVISGSGTLTMDGTFAINTAVSIPSTITINKPGGSSTSGTGLCTVNGIMNWTGGGISSPFTIAAGATLNASSATKAINTTLINNGSLNWSSGTFNFNNGTLTNNGTIDNSYDGLLSVFSGTNSFVNNGTFRKSVTTGITTVAIPAINSGTLTGQGTLTFNNTFTNNGVVDPGTTLGSLTLTTSASPILSASSTVSIEMLDGSGAGIGNDLMVINQNLLLNGTLTVTETGTVPNGTYTIINLTAGAITGTFSTVNLPTGYSLNVAGTAVSITKAIVLPVKLISFSGRLINDNMELVWRTASDYNFNRFEIERSANGNNYTVVGTVVKQPGIGAIQNYSFFESSPFGLHYFYRLKMIDNDDKFSYSPVVKIVSNRGSETPKIYPNPSVGNIYISLPMQWLKASIIVRNASGQVVTNFTATTQAGEINLAAQPDGVYILTFIKDKRSITQRIVKTSN